MVLLGKTAGEMFLCGRTLEPTRQPSVPPDTLMILKPKLLFRVTAVPLLVMLVSETGVLSVRDTGLAQAHFKQPKA
jgi:hypothetical protein